MLFCHVFSQNSAGKRQALVLQGVFQGVVGAAWGSPRAEGDPMADRFQIHPLCYNGTPPQLGELGRREGHEFI